MHENGCVCLFNLRFILWKKKKKFHNFLVFVANSLIIKIKNNNKKKSFIDQINEYLLVIFFF